MESSRTGRKALCLIHVCAIKIPLMPQVIVVTLATNVYSIVFVHTCLKWLERVFFKRLFSVKYNLLNFFLMISKSIISHHWWPYAMLPCPHLVKLSIALNYFEKESMDSEQKPKTRPRPILGAAASHHLWPWMIYLVQQLCCSPHRFPSIRSTERNICFFKTTCIVHNSIML